ncbi:PEP-CTERM sorting domain-containing protein [Limnofasciculus baicalensis]|uniref:PEP-CTERM sorting domain-containing protein n=1 Tax=Limnofasciculus baicalensis BBK-W-15 TaxID=2699891 RepID=A0AAE3KQI9_9CYAN|nr:PEP-CTERM sorting domain-containing protein [Limnofasciculus baicalensis]MCP2732540.1 PEP-CTERM sorting domain-containing protein [Limnofasciculus baicalensis BBK-W-15]
MNNKCLLCTIPVIAVIGFNSSAMGAVLDLTSLTPGAPGTGSFTGSLGSVSVNGSLLSGGDNSFRIAVTGDEFYTSTIDNSSSQFRQSNIYTPSQFLSDRVGYNMEPNMGNATLQINFSKPVTNPVFHVANLDSMIYDFSPSGITRSDLVLLSGNGGSDGDGLAIDSVNPLIVDGIPSTFLAQHPSDPIPTSSVRSAYGSVQLKGTFSSLNILLKKDQTLPSFFGDSGSFTLTTVETVPEPTSTLSLLALGTLGAGSAIKRKQK